MCSDNEAADMVAQLVTEPARQLDGDTGACLMTFLVL